jgi:hypothetical protein
VEDRQLDYPAMLGVSSAFASALCGAGFRPSTVDAAFVTIGATRHLIVPHGVPSGSPQVAPADVDLTVSVDLTDTPIGNCDFSMVVAGGRLRSFAPSAISGADVELVVPYETWFATLAGELPYTAVTEAPKAAGMLWAICHLTCLVGCPLLHDEFRGFRSASVVHAAFASLVPVDR